MKLFARTMCPLMGIAAILLLTGSAFAQSQQDWDDWNDFKISIDDRAEAADDLLRDLFNCYGPFTKGPEIQDQLDEYADDQNMAAYWDLKDNWDAYVLRLNWMRNHLDVHVSDAKTAAEGKMSLWALDVTNLQKMTDATNAVNWYDAKVLEVEAIMHVAQAYLEYIASNHMVHWQDDPKLLELLQPLDSSLQGGGPEDPGGGIQ